MIIDSKKVEKKAKTYSAVGKRFVPKFNRKKTGTEKIADNANIIIGLSISIAMVIAIIALAYTVFTEGSSAIDKKLQPKIQNQPKAVEVIYLPKTK